MINEEFCNIDIKDILVFEDNNISYDTLKINKIESNIDSKIQRELISIDDGIISDYFIPSRIRNGRFKNIKYGVLCDVSIGSIRGSTLFSNIGPTIPLRLLFSSQINSNVDIEVNEYGINNAIVKIYLTVDIMEQVTMPLSSDRKRITIRRPIKVDIIRGKIPDYYTGLSR